MTSHMILSAFLTLCLALPSVGLAQSNVSDIGGGDDDDSDFVDSLIDQQEENILDRGYFLMASKWDFNEVFVCWEAMDPAHENARRLVQRAVAETWEKHSAFSTFGWTQCVEGSQGIRIAIKDMGPHVKGLGKFVNGKKDGMVLNFTYNNWSPSCRVQLDYCNRVIAVHEFGHALGFAHEHNRSDTPDDCTRAPQGTDGDTFLTERWDESSVMNYCNPIYSNAGELSPGDIESVQKIYGAPL